MTGTVSSIDAGGAAFEGGGQITGGSEGTPGTSYLPPGTACPESVAWEEGKAVTHVGADKQCKGIQGMRIVIGDIASTVNEAFNMVNKNFGCAGQQPCCGTSLALSNMGPVVT